MYIRYLWQGNHQIYGHIRCIYTVLANPKHCLCATFKLFVTRVEPCVPCTYVISGRETTRSYTVNIYIYIYIYDHGQPCTYVISGREITKYMVIYGEYIYDHGQPCIYVISGREITKYMVIYGEYIYDYGQL